MMFSVSRETPVPIPAPALAYADVWYAVYDAINQHGLDELNVPTMPASVTAQGRIPPAVSRYINHAFAAGTKDARTASSSQTAFPVPDHDTEAVATCVLERYYQ